MKLLFKPGCFPLCNLELLWILVGFKTQSKEETLKNVISIYFVELRFQPITAFRDDALQRFVLSLWL